MVPLYCNHCGNTAFSPVLQPWVEHAGWFSSCEFVLLVKGWQFVEISKRKVTQTLVGGQGDGGETNILSAGDQEGLH